MFGNMAQDLGKHALMAGAGAFKNTVTPDFVTKLVTKGVNAATNAIARWRGAQGSVFLHRQEDAEERQRLLPGQENAEKAPMNNPR